MTNEKLYEVLGDINEKHIQEAHMTTAKTGKSAWVKWGAMTACVAVVVAVAMFVPLQTRETTLPERDGNAETDYVGAPKIILNGCDYYATDLTILNELPEGYIYAGELTDEEKKYAYIDGNQYYIPEGEETIDDFYVYQECGTPISDTEVDNTQRQWAYVKWSKH